MKKFFSSIIVMAIVLLIPSCQSTKNVVSSSAKSETAGLCAGRLDSCLTIATLSNWLTLKVDSMILVLAPRDILPTHHSPIGLAAANVSRDSLNAFPNVCSKPPSAGSGSTGNAQRSTAQPSALKIYGIHVDACNNTNAVKQSSSKETVAAATDSFHSEEDIEHKSTPSSAPKYIFYILLIAVAIEIYHKLRS